MGDRAQIIIRRAGTVIHLYAHWNGYMLPKLLGNGLRAGQGRWDDDSYLTRILFCNMLEKGDLRETTGFGISTQYQDSSPETDLIVDMDEKRVYYMDHYWSFADYIAMPRDSWETLS